MKKIGKLTFKNFTLKTAKKDIYIFGTSKLGQGIYRVLTGSGIKVSGFLDNNPKTYASPLLGCRVCSPVEIKPKQKKTFVIIGTISYQWEIMQQLLKEGFKNFITTPQLSIIFPDIQKENMTIRGLKEDFAKNKKEYKNFYRLLSDRKSKKVLKTLMAYRKTFNPFLFYKINSGEEKQYLESFVPDSPVPFVDCGGFTGDTLERFLKSGRKYSRIYFFEPDPKSFEKACRDFSGVKNIDFYNKGLHSREVKLLFDSAGALGSCVSGEGNTVISCVSLDSVIQEERAFIKMDIEGSEKFALEGSKRLIENNSVLAVSVYHLAEDIWKIPLIIMNLNPNYKFFLRHYSDINTETVLYCIPKSGF